MLDLPADADDEAMMELAIALSLQEQAGAQGLSLQGLPLPGVQAQSLPVEAGVSSDNASGMIRSSYSHLGNSKRMSFPVQIYNLLCLLNSG